ncbi:MAG: diguanylate cyclase [Reinekea sp.]
MSNASQFLPKYEQLLSLAQIVLVLVVLSFPIWSKNTFTISPTTESTDYHIDLTSDHENGGTSTAKWLSDGPDDGFYWQCNITHAIAYPYCSFLISFSHGIPPTGFDMSKVYSITLDYEYKSNQNDTIRIFLRSVEPGLTDPTDWNTLKYNQAEFRPSRYGSPLTLEQQDFSVAQWWLLAQDLPLEQSRVNFDEVFSFEIATGSDIQEGIKTFRLNSLTFNMQRISSENFYRLMVIVIISLLFMQILLRYYTLNRSYTDTRRLADTLSNQANRDHMTQVLNRRAFNSIFQIAQSEWRNGCVNYSLVLVDIDHFKKINDHYGHSTGDQVLIQFAEILKQHSRGNDTVARWGGEEFVMLLPHTDCQHAIASAKRVQAVIQQTKWPGDITVTASFGVETAKNTDSTETLFDRADNSLYQAKRTGRNQAHSSCLEADQGSE